MARQQTTNVQWQDPNGTWHQPGEIAVLDETLVFDWSHLVDEGTITVVDVVPSVPPDPTPAPTPDPAPTGE